MPILKHSWSLAIAIGLAGCGGLGLSGEGMPNLELPPLAETLTGPTQPIDQAQQAEVGTSIMVEGTVQRVAPLASGGLYALADDTGSVWIKTTAPLPNPGDNLRVDGVLAYQAVVIGGADRGEFFIEERDRRNVTRPNTAPSPDGADPPANPG